MHAKSLQLCLTFCDPTDCSPPASSIFSRRECWSGLPCPPPGNVPNPGIKLTSLRSPALAGRFLTTGATCLYIVKYSSYRRDRIHAQFFALDYQFLLGFLDILILGFLVFLITQLVKNPPAMQETWVRSLGWENPLENFRLPTPVFLSGEFHELYGPWGHKESDTTEQQSLSPIFNIECF